MNNGPDIKSLYIFKSARNTCSMLDVAPPMDKAGLVTACLTLNCPYMSVFLTKKNLFFPSLFLFHLIVNLAQKVQTWAEFTVRLKEEKKMAESDRDLVVAFTNIWIT